MKKEIIGILTAAGCLLSVSGYAAYADEQILLGDINNDNSVTADDALMILNAVVGNRVLTDNQSIAADVNRDNRITSDDAMLVLQYVANIISGFDAPSTTEPPQTTAPDESSHIWSLVTTVSTTVSDTENTTAETTVTEESTGHIWSVVNTDNSSETTDSENISSGTTITEISETTVTEISESETTVTADSTETEDSTTETTTVTEETTTETTVTTEPPQTTTESETTTTFQLPKSYKISGVTPIVQSGLPTGCEATGLTIALRWYGFNVTKEKMALQYMPRQDFTYQDGKKIGPDFIYKFAGDPTRNSNSYGCYIPCMMQTVKNYFNDIGCTDYTVEDLTGTSLDNLFYYVAKNTPVAVITTNNLITPYRGDSWYTPDGRYVTWQRGHHCMIITGYDYAKNVVHVSESAYSVEKTYSMDQFRNIYDLKGKNAMIIKKVSDEPKLPVNTEDDVYVTPFADGDICTLRNFGSGKMLNVDYGKDANKTNVYQWSADNSKEQTFKMNLMSDGSYMIRTMCSSDGSNRTLDIERSNGNIVSGGNVDIYDPTDTNAQRWLFVKTADNKYKIVPAYNKSLALTVYGDANGSADGTSSSSMGNAFVSDYCGSAYQQWSIVKIN